MKSKVSSHVVLLVVVFILVLAMNLVATALALVSKRLGMPMWTAHVFVVLVVAWLILSFMKRLVLKGHPDAITVVPAVPENFPWLDLEALAQLSANLRALGFLPVCDVTLKAEGGNWPPSFTRVLENQQTHCQAELIQVQSRLSPGIHCHLNSDLEDDWSIATTTRPPLGGTWLIRKPKSLWTSHPGMNLEELLHAHLIWRDNLAYHLGVQVLEDFSVEKYEQQLQRSERLNKEIIRRKPMVSILIENKLFSMNPKMEWRGVFDKAAKKRAHTRG